MNTVIVREKRQTDSMCRYSCDLFDCVLILCSQQLKVLPIIFVILQIMPKSKLASFFDYSSLLSCMKAVLVL